MILDRQRNCWMRLAGPLDGIYASPHQLPFAGIAQLVAEDIKAALDIGVDIMLVPPEKMLVGARALAEKKLSLPWDLLITG